MEKRENKITKESEVSEQINLPKYEPPKIITYTSDDIEELIGPAQACSPSPFPNGWSLF